MVSMKKILDEYGFEISGDFSYKMKVLKNNTNEIRVNLNKGHYSVKWKATNKMLDLCQKLGNSHAFYFKDGEMYFYFIKDEEPFKQTDSFDASSINKDVSVFCNKNFSVGGVVEKDQALFNSWDKNIGFHYGFPWKLTDNNRLVNTVITDKGSLLTFKDGKIISLDMGLSNNS